MTKKQNKTKNSTCSDFIFCVEFHIFFCYWKIRQSRPTIVLKQMDFAAFTSKRHLKMFDWRQMGGWVSSQYYVTNKGICDVKYRIEACQELRTLAVRVQAMTARGIKIH